MKFAHEFKATLLKEGFPVHWVESAIPYSQLKKVLKKVSRELQEIGLDPATLAHFVPNPGQDSQQSRRGSQEGAAYQYIFEGDYKDFRPKLTLFFEDELAINATLSPDTRLFLENLVAKQIGSPLKHNLLEQGYKTDKKLARFDSPERYGPGVRRVEVNLTFDAEFFDLLQGNLSNLDKLQAGEQKAITNDIGGLSQELITIAKPPSRFHSKTDMCQWRELFYIYLEAGVFFSTREVDSGSRTSTQAAKQLNWFRDEVIKQGLMDTFKLSASRLALERFISINISLLLNLKYQELQQKAIGKITKKFEKRTKLEATTTFPTFIKLDPIMSNTMAKAVCAQVNQDLVKLIPQLDDYLCPICFTIAYRPIRMSCRHVICIRCTVYMQRRRQGACPICRENVIMEANTDNIDKQLTAFQKKHFPVETRQKKIELETADGIERFGPAYKHPSEFKSDSSCSTM